MDADFAPSVIPHKESPVDIHDNVILTLRGRARMVKRVLEDE